MPRRGPTSSTSRFANVPFTPTHVSVPPRRSRCLAAFFCSCVVIPQLTERMTGMPGKCKKLCMLLWGLYVVYLGLSVGHQVWGAMMWMDSDDEEEEEVEDEEEQRSWGGMGGGSPLGRPQQVASLVFWVAAIHLGIQVRRRIRQRDGIFEDRCTECLTVACCHGCVNSQMLRQLDIDGSNYQLCSTTGDGAPVGPSRV